MPHKIQIIQMKKENLRIVFMGTPDFAVGSLRALVENKFNIVGVITAADKPAGRGQKLQESAVKQYAVSQNIHVMQPEKLKNPLFLNELTSLKADLQIVVAFRMLPEVVWSMPPLGTFNLHGSLLPQYRGAAPINWAIMNGEKETGVTTFFIEHKIDTGSIIDQAHIPIGLNDNAEKIHDRLMNVGANLVVETVNHILAKDITPMPQNSIRTDTPLNEAPKIFKADCKINWARSGDKLHDFIRGLSPYPAAWCIFLKQDKAIHSKIFKATFTPEKQTPKAGTIFSDNSTMLKVACANGWLNILELQIAGKKRMMIQDFLRGFDASDLRTE